LPRSRSTILQNESNKTIVSLTLSRAIKTRYASEPWQQYRKQRNLLDNSGGQHGSGTRLHHICWKRTDGFPDHPREIQAGEKKLKATGQTWVETLTSAPDIIEGIT
jgi:hypothetical protein